MTAEPSRKWQPSLDYAEALGIVLDAASQHGAELSKYRGTQGVADLIDNALRVVRMEMLND